MAVDVGEAKIAALVAIGQLRVVDAELVEDHRLEIVDVDGARVNRSTLGSIGWPSLSTML